MPPRAGFAGFVPHLLLLAMMAIWGGSYAAVKIALQTESPFAVVAVRFWLAVLCVLPFAVGRERGAFARARRAGVITGLVLLPGFALQTAGMTETTASMSGFLAGLIVLLVAIGGALFLGARMRANTVFGLGLGFAGLVPLCMVGADSQVQSITLRGVLLQVASAVCYAAHILLISRLSPRGLELQYCVWQMLVVAVGASVLQLGAEGIPALAPWSEPATLWSIGYIGVFATALGIAVQSRVQPQIPPTHVAALFALQPVFAAMAGSLCLGDRLGPRQLLGGALIVLGVLVAGLRR